jgi:leucyl-tRNA synthetase
LAIQINGKRRDEIRVPKGSTRDYLEPIVLNLESVKRVLDGKPVTKFIVVPDRIINIVCAS